MFSVLTSRSRVRTNPPGDAFVTPEIPAVSRALSPRPMSKIRGRGFGTRVAEPSNPDYLAQKHKLDHLASFLGAALSALAETMAAWGAVAKQQSHFAALVAQAGSGRSGGRDKCARAARVTAACAREIGPEAMRQTVVPDVMEQLRRFLAHVTALQDRQRDVRKMKREVDAAATRLRQARGKLGGGMDAIAKAQERYDKGKETYDGMVRRMAERMAEANGRTADVVRTVHYLYWLLQEKASNMLYEATEVEMSAANAAEPALCYVAFCHGLKSPATMFNGLELRHDASRT